MTQTWSNWVAWARLFKKSAVTETPGALDPPFLVLAAARCGWPQDRLCASQSLWLGSTSLCFAGKRTETYRVCLQRRGLRLKEKA